MLFFVTSSLILSSCSKDDKEDDNVGPDLNLQISNVDDSSVEIKWDLLEDVTDYNVVITEKDSDDAIFSVDSEIDPLTGEPEDNIKITSLNPSTKYTAIVTAMDDDFEIISQYEIDFTTSDEPPMSALNLRVINVDHSSVELKWDLLEEDVDAYCVVITEKISGDEVFNGSSTLDPITGELQDNITANSLNPITEYNVSLTAYNDDIEILSEDDIDFITSEEPPLPEIENITGVEDNNGNFDIAWDAFEGAHGYFIYINNVAISDLPTCSIPYTIYYVPEKLDTIRIDAWDQLKEEVIASGYIVYREDEPEPVTDPIFQAGDGQVSISWTEPIGKYDQIIISQGLHPNVVLQTLDKGVTETVVSGLTNFENVNIYVQAYNSESDKISSSVTEEVMPVDANSIYLSTTEWNSTTSDRELVFDYFRDVYARNVVTLYFDGDSDRLSFYFSVSDNTGKIKNKDWNGWETSSEYIPFSYDNETKQISFDGDIYEMKNL